MRAISTILPLLFCGSCAAQGQAQQFPDGPLTVILKHDGPVTPKGSQITGAFTCQDFRVDIEWGLIQGIGSRLTNIHINGVKLTQQRLDEINEEFSEPLAELTGISLANCQRPEEEPGLFLIAYKKHAIGNKSHMEQYYIKVTDSSFEFQEGARFTYSHAYDFKKEGAPE